MIIKKALIDKKISNEMRGLVAPKIISSSPPSKQNICYCSSLQQKEIIEESLKDIIWPDDKRKFSSLKTEIARLKVENPDQPISLDQLSNLPFKTKKEEAIERIEEILKIKLLNKNVSETDITKAIVEINKNSIITALLK